MTRNFILALCALGVSPVLAADSESDALAKAAQGFYGVYMTLHPSDGIPDPATRARFEPFVSPALNELLVEGHDAEVRYAKATKNQSPPLIEGDLFTPNFEGATAFKIGACESDSHGGHCAVILTYDDRKDKPISWTDTVLFVRTPSGWRVDDVAYGGSAGFGNRGRLTGTLKDAIENGNAFSK